MAEELMDGPENPFLKSLKEFKQNKTVASQPASSTAAISPFGDIVDAQEKKKPLLHRLMQALKAVVRNLYPHIMVP